MALTIRTIPCLSDNYVYLLHDPTSGATGVVDVPDGEVVKTALATEGWTLDQIFLTHHHWDHIDGVPTLDPKGETPIMGAASDAKRLPTLSAGVTEGDKLEFAGEPVEIFDVPGHTIGHIAYYFPRSKALFSGDSLMVMGCGRLFEGTPAQMWDSLAKLMALPDDTLVFSGHEYTASNAKFALSVDPDNKALVERMTQISEIRARGGNTMEATLALEKATNPFLRASHPEMKAQFNMDNAPDAEVFAELRKRKDNF